MKFFLSLFAVLFNLQIILGRDRTLAEYDRIESRSLGASDDEEHHHVHCKGKPGSSKLELGIRSLERSRLHPMIQELRLNVRQTCGDPIQTCEGEIYNLPVSAILQRPCGRECILLEDVTSVAIDYRLECNTTIPFPSEEDIAVFGLKV